MSIILTEYDELDWEYGDFDVNDTFTKYYSKEHMLETDVYEKRCEMLKACEKCSTDK